MFSYLSDISSSLYLCISKSPKLGSAKKTPSESIVCSEYTRVAFQFSPISCPIADLKPSYSVPFTLSSIKAFVGANLTPDKSAPA